MNRKLQYLVEKLKKQDYKPCSVTDAYNVILKPYVQKLKYTQEFKDLLKIVSSVTKVPETKKKF